MVVTFLYMIAEIVGGIYSNSLALLADAGHMLADVAALGISLVAFEIAKRPASDKATFGYMRAEILAALFNGIALFIIAFFIIREAIGRLLNPEQISSEAMVIVALGGLLINIIGLVILHEGKTKNLNLHGAWLHVLSDTLGSVGVVISGTLIYFFGWKLSDPIASILISLLVGYSAISLILKTVRVLMEQTPEHIDPQEVRRAIGALKGTVRVHDLHIWTITSGHEALSMHVEAEVGVDYDNLLNEIKKVLSSRFGISHTTIQIERECLGPQKICS